MKNILFTVFFFTFFSLFSQQKHTVIAKETLYSITKKYDISAEQLIKANPVLKERGLQPGDELMIPIKNTNSTPVNSIPITITKVIKEENGLLQLEIGTKETLYNICKKYKTTEEILKKHNPFLTERMLNPGDIVKIPTSNHKGLTKVVENKPTKEVNKLPEPTKFKTEIVSQNDEYLTLKTGTDESIAQLSVQYDITEKKLKRENYFLKDREIQQGDLVRIPMSRKVKSILEEQNRFTETKVIEETKDYIYIKTGNNETLYHIAQTYAVTIDQILKDNPELKNSELKKGDTLKIPNRKKLMEKYKDDTISIVYFLPFELNNKNKTGGKIASTNFLAGSRIALDSLSHKGKKIKISVFDSANEREFDSILKNYDFRNTDLVIGPLKQTQLEKSSLALSTFSIPIVSPAVNNSTLSQLPNFILPNTSEDTQIEVLTQEIQKVNNNQLVYLLASPKQTDLAEKIKQLLNNKQFTDVKIITTASEITIPKNIMTEKFQAIIPILIVEEANTANDFITKINELDSNFTLPFSLNYFKSFEDPKNIEILSKTGFTYTYVEKANLKDINTQKTIALFKKSFCETPDKYAIMGFDITYDLVSRMNESGEITFTQEQQQISTQYNYIRKEKNTFENNGVRIEKIEKKKPATILN